MKEEVNKKIVENVLASFEIDAIKVPEQVVNKIMKKLNIKNDKRLVLGKKGR